MTTAPTAAHSAPSTKFSLLLLDHNEWLLESISSTLSIHYSNTSTPPSSFPAGRLWIATTSIFYEPTKSSTVWRFPLTTTTSPPRLVDETICMDCNRIIKIIPGSSYTPSEVVCQLRLTPKHTKADKVHPLLNELWRAARAKGSPSETLTSRLNEPFDRSRLLDFREKVLMPGANEPTISVERIEPLVTTPGCLVLTESHVYFQPCRLNNLLGSRACTIWRLDEITSFSKRRYMMTQRGLEIVSGTNRPTQLFAFRQGYAARDAFWARLADLLPELECVRVSSEARLNEATRKWQLREIDNFTYLSILNREADRSVDDLTQFPVFPWVLADYTSASLDLENPTIYRDLRLPMGALNPARLAQLQERMKFLIESADPHPFLYGTHYSAPGFVIYYLVRERPNEMLRLQNGKFDSPDRMFWSVQETWLNATRNPTDVKELIPQFYSGDGSFLKNSLELEFFNHRGAHGDVQLPPWAQGDAAKFVQLMRRALESEYVSNNIHHWIDLIFGYKQQGKCAIEANNTFYYLTYEGAVPDLDALEDENERKSFETQMMEFGQTPKCLFRAPHPQRDDSSTATTMAGSFPIPHPSASQPPSSGGGPIAPTGPKLARFLGLPWSLGKAGAPAGLTSTLQDGEKPLTSTKWINEAHPRGKVCDLSVSGSKVYSCSLDGTLLTLSAAQGVVRRTRVGKASLSCVQYMRATDSVLTGSWDNSLLRYSASTGRVIEKIERAHEDAVSCCAVTTAEEVSLFTGGWDSSVKLWDAAAPGGLRAVAAFYEPHRGPVRDVHTGVISDPYIVASCGDEYMALHDARSGHAPVWSWFAPRGFQRVAAATRHRLVAVSAESGLSVLDLRRTKHEPQSQVAGQRSFRSLCVTKNGALVIVGDQLGKLGAAAIDDVERLAFESSVWEKRGDSSEITALAADDDVVISGSASGGVGIHEWAR